MSSGSDAVSCLGGGDAAVAVVAVAVADVVGECVSEGVPVDLDPMERTAVRSLE
jgi:hypothetical protein